MHERSAVVFDGRVPVTLDDEGHRWSPRANVLRLTAGAILRALRADPTRADEVPELAESVAHPARDALRELARGRYAFRWAYSVWRFRRRPPGRRHLAVVRPPLGESVGWATAARWALSWNYDPRDRLPFPEPDLMPEVVEV